MQSKHAVLLYMLMWWFWLFYCGISSFISLIRHVLTWSLVGWKCALVTGIRYEQQSHMSTHWAQNVSFPLSPLFPLGRHSVNTPFRCSVGDYKSKLQLYRDRRGHPSNPPSALPFLSPPSFSGTSSVPSDFSSPLASSLCCTNASCHWWCHLGLVCDLPLLVSVCKDRVDTVQAAPGKPTTQSDLPYIDTGNTSLHIINCEYSTVAWTEDRRVDSIYFLFFLERHGWAPMKKILKVKSVDLVTGLLLTLALLPPWQTPLL